MVGNDKTLNFVNRASEIHCNKYDYSLSKYTNTRTDIFIICPDHGPFTQKPYSHLAGIGCSTCTYESKRITTDTFVARSIKIHGNRYDYSKVVYTKSNIPIIVICKEHGEFKQLPTSHVRGAGCKLCYYNSMKLSTAEFIDKANLIHQHKYTYDNVVYKHTHTPVFINCNQHGVFQQQPNDHLQGRGCSKCTLLGRYNSNTFLNEESRNIRGWIYLIHLFDGNESFYKIGITTNIQRRLTRMSNYYDYKLIFSLQHSLYRAFQLEQQIILKYPSYAPTEIFAGYTECLNLTPSNVISIIEQLY